MQTQRLDLSKGSKIILYLPANFFHSNVSAENRRRYIENFRALIAMLKSAGFPVALSLQGIDLKLIGLTKEDFEGIELLDAPWAHFLATEVGDDEDMGKNAAWQITHGLIGGCVARFCPEFDTPPQRRLLPHAGQIIPIVPRSTVTYSTCEIEEAGEVIDGQVIYDYDCVGYNGNFLVPMGGVDTLTRAWFQYQLMPIEANMNGVVSQIRQLVEGREKRVYIWFVDFEAPIVGSFHGFKLWENLFSAIREAELTEAFTTFEDSADYFKEKAAGRKLSDKTLVMRNLGKWKSWEPQNNHMRAAAKLPRPVTDFEHAVYAYITGSDVLSAMGSKATAANPRAAMQNDWTMADIDPAASFDQTIISIAVRLLQIVKEHGYNRPMILACLRDLKSNDTRFPTTEDGQWFASLNADMLEQMAA